MVTGNSAIFEPFDPLGRMVDSIAEGNVEVGYSPIVLNIAVGSPVKHIFIVFNMVVEPLDLFFEVAYFAGFMGFSLRDS